MYILKKDNKYLSNIIPQNAKVKSIFSDNESFAIKFSDKKDASTQAKRFKCKLVEL